MDRTAYVWAVRVNYVNTDTDEVFWSTGYLDPDTATYASLDGGTAGTLGTDAYFQSNADAHPSDTHLADGWRVAEYLDGVAVTQHHQSTQFDRHAFDRLMEHTCDHLENDFATEKGCLVDQTGSVRGNGTTYSTIYNSFPTDDAWNRMNSADRWGHGTLSYYLPLSLENVGTNGGRYTERGLLDTSYSTVVYEPRLTRSQIGEVHEWEWTVPAGCGGTSSIDRELSVETDAPVLEWFVKRNSTASQQGPVETAASPTGSTSISGVSAGDSLQVGWKSLGGGASVDHTNNVHFSIDGTTSPCTPASTSTTWTHSTDFSDLSGSSIWGSFTMSAAEALYECIIRYYQSPSAAGDGDTDDCK